jgi:hypothetical protein
MSTKKSKQLVKKDEMIGRRFDRVVVVGRGSVAKNGARNYIYKCDCGTVKETLKANLCKKLVRSCGCYRSEMLRNRDNSNRRKKFPDSALRRLFTLTRKKATNERGLAFDLTMKQFEELTSRRCQYCGEPPREYSLARSGKGGGIYTTRANGIDRIDSQLGYSDENCVPCCKFCNIAKNDYSVEDFLLHIYNIAFHQGWLPAPIPEYHNQLQEPVSKAERNKQ